MQNDPESHSIEQQIAMTNPPKAAVEEQLIKKAVLRLNGHILGFVMGVIGAIAVFVATNWLVLKGGDVVGPHLGLLGQFFIGYSVSFLGSLIGAAYIFVIGYIGGLLISWIYNSVAFLGKGK
ncbi:MAG TPA: hypothetical protein VK468_07830 [Pyrinomonadaceae bacterium]|nr:hypothetical protein [Pyrinomonadaceae bacterium]